jgi:hypothetical protein
MKSNVLTSKVLQSDCLTSSLELCDPEIQRSEYFVPLISEYSHPQQASLPIYSLQGMGVVAFKCNQLFDVIVFDEHGYYNAFVELGNELSEINCALLHQLGVSVLVYFTDVYGASFDVDEAEYIAKRYCIRLCEINLPFKVSNIDKWDEFQWCLFDKRVNQALSLLGVRNEKYQS